MTVNDRGIFNLEKLFLFEKILIFLTFAIEREKNERAETVFKGKVSRRVNEVSTTFAADNARFLGGSHPPFYRRWSGYLQPRATFFI